MYLGGSGAPPGSIDHPRQAQLFPSAAHRCSSGAQCSSFKAQGWSSEAQRCSSKAQGWSSEAHH